MSSSFRAFHTSMMALSAKNTTTVAAAGVGVCFALSLVTSASMRKDNQSSDRLAKIALRNQIKAYDSAKH